MNVSRNIEIDIRDAIKKSYGFVANPRYSPAHNASILLTLMPSWHYFF